MKSITLDRAQQSKMGLNEDFWARALMDVDPRFYDQLEAAGCDIEGSVLVELNPDETHCWFGTLIRQDGKVFAFDLTLDRPELAGWTDRTDDFLRTYRHRRRHKPWADEVVAYEIFLERQRERSGGGGG